MTPRALFSTATVVTALASSPCPAQPTDVRNAAALAPAAPFGLQVLEVNGTSALLEWKPGPGIARGFKIRPGSSPGVHPDPGLYPGGKRAAFSFTTDDGKLDNLLYDGIFTRRGLRYTAFVNPGKLGPTKMQWPDIEQLFRNGHEVYSHGQDHVALIDDRALTVRYRGAEPCTLTIVGKVLQTFVEGTGPDLSISLTDPSAFHLVDLVATLNGDPDYEAVLLYSPQRRLSTESDLLDPVPAPGVSIGGPAPAETLTTSRGVHDDSELLAQIQDAEAELESHLTSIDPPYECRFLAYPAYGHTQRVMTLLNELGYTAARAGVLGHQPFDSEGTPYPGFTTSYEVPHAIATPRNFWSEDTTRAILQRRITRWKQGREWTVLLSHTVADVDSLHAEWLLDEVASDPEMWVAPFGEVADHLASFSTDVGLPVDSGRARAWIHGLSPSETTWVVVTAYGDSLDESAWSNEVAIPPPSSASPPAGAAAWSAASRKARAFPNPFPGETTIRFRVEREGPFALEVFDVRGARVDLRELGVLPAGPVLVPWTPGTISPGVYLYQVRERGNGGAVVARGKLCRLR